MAKIFKALVVVILLVSVVALVFGVLLFNQREELKGRTQRLEQAAEDIAGRIRYDEFDPAAIQDYDRMEAPLRRLAVAAENQYEELQATTRELAETRSSLEDARNQLAETRQELSESQDTVARLEGEVRERDNRISGLNSNIAQLERDKQALNDRISDLDDQLIQRDELVRDLEDQVVSLENALARLEAELGTEMMVQVPEGLSGRVELVNPQWRFVVLNIGREQGLVPNAEMLVHRDDDLIGKVRVSMVEDDLSVAEIMADWQVTELRKGDNVFF